MSIALIGVVVTGCSSGAFQAEVPPPTTGPLSGTGRSVLVGSLAPCVPRPTIAVDDVAARLPAGVSFPAGSRLIETYRLDGSVTVVADSDLSVNQLFEHFRAQLAAAGHEVFAADNEGREAELFFAERDGGIGAVRETQPRCPSGVTRVSVTSSEPAL